MTVMPIEIHCCSRSSNFDCLSLLSSPLIRSLACSSNSRVLDNSSCSWGLWECIYLNGGVRLLVEKLVFMVGLCHPMIWLLDCVRPYLIGSGYFVQGFFSIQVQVSKVLSARRHFHLDMKVADLCGIEQIALLDNPGRTQQVVCNRRIAVCW